MRLILVVLLMGLGAAPSRADEPKPTAESLLNEMSEENDQRIIDEIMREIEAGAPKRSTKTRGNCRYDADCAPTHDCVGYSPARMTQALDGTWVRRRESFGACIIREELNNPDDEGESI